MDYSGCTFKPNSNLIVGIVEVTVDMATGTFNGKNGIQNVLHRVSVPFSVTVDRGFVKVLPDLFKINLKST